MYQYFHRNLDAFFFINSNKDVFRKAYVGYTYFHIETSFQMPEVISIISSHKSMRDYQER